MTRTKTPTLLLVKTSLKTTWKEGYPEEIILFSGSLGINRGQGLE